MGRRLPQALSGVTHAGQEHVAGCGEGARFTSPSELRVAKLGGEPDQGARVRKLLATLSGPFRAWVPGAPGPVPLPGSGRGTHHPPRPASPAPGEPASPAHPVSPSEVLSEILTPPWLRPPPGSSPRVRPANPDPPGPSRQSLEGLEVPQFAPYLPPPREKAGCGLTAAWSPAAGRLSPSAGPGLGLHPAGLSGPDQAWPPVSWPGCPYSLFQELAVRRVHTRRPAGGPVPRPPQLSFST